MSKNRREQEEEILRQMDEAMAEQAERAESAESMQKEAEPEQPRKIYGVLEDKTPKEVHCSRCKTMMQNGVCPTCGYRMYVPMDEKKRKKIKLIGTVVGMVIFAIIFIILEITK